MPAVGMIRRISSPLGKTNVRNSSRAAIMASTWAQTGPRAVRVSMAAPTTMVTTMPA